MIDTTLQNRSENYEYCADVTTKEHHYEANDKKKLPSSGRSDEIQVDAASCPENKRRENHEDQALQDGSQTEKDYAQIDIWNTEADEYPEIEEEERTDY